MCTIFSESKITIEHKRTQQNQVTSKMRISFEGFDFKDTIRHDQHRHIECAY